MKTKRLMRWKEWETLEVLERSLRGTPYRVFSKVRMSDVLGLESSEENLASEERNFLMTAHFDFLVCDRRNYCGPVFAVEFDGPHHQEEEQVRRDIRKNRLCKRANLQLLRVGYNELEQHEQMTLLEFMILRFIAWQREHGQILEEIETYLAGLTPEEIQHLTMDGVADPSIDPTVLFDLKHQFPGIAKVSRRLLSRFRIETGHVPSGVVAKVITKGPTLRCQVWPYSGYNTGYQEVREVSYTVRERNGGILCRGSTKFAMCWTLPVVEDYTPEESGAEYLLRAGELPYMFVELPGVHIPDIVESFSDYLALREVEKWAQAHLPALV